MGVQVYQRTKLHETSYELDISQEIQGRIRSRLSGSGHL